MYARIVTQVHSLRSRDKQSKQNQGAVQGSNVLEYGMLIAIIMCMSILSSCTCLCSMYVPLMWSDQVMALATPTVACSYEEVVQCEQYCYDYTMTMALSVMLTHLCY